MVRFFDFSRYHGKSMQGSTYIRVKQLIDNWPEAGMYKYGENPDVLIFQKVYVSQDYLFPKHFEGIKILDICDPDWKDGALIKATVDCMDAVVTSTESLADFIRQLTDKPVRFIKDRWELKDLPKPKEHTKKAESVVWFGYAHNSELLKPAFKLIDELDLELIVVANEDPFYNRFVKKYKFYKFSQEMINTDLQRADYCLLPQGFRPEDRFKSNNKTSKAILLGLPVATDSDSMKLFMDPEARKSYLDNNYAKVKKEYDVKNSVNEYKELIGELQRSKAQS